MKTLNFVEFKTENGQSLINLSNVTDVFAKGDKCVMYLIGYDNKITVSENYETVKSKIFDAQYPKSYIEI